jgi:hypothetical protein
MVFINFKYQFLLLIILLEYILQMIINFLNYIDVKNFDFDIKKLFYMI